MATQACLLGIDLGTSSVKAALATANGRVVSSGSAEYPILRPQPGYAEQDPAAWWRAVCDAVRIAMKGAGGPVDVQAIGLSGQMHGTVLVGANGEPLAPAVIWPDQRSAEQVVQLTERVGLARLVEIAGSPVATGFQAATLLWVRQNEPALWRRIHKVLLPKDYVRLRMTGEALTDPSDGSGTLLLDVGKRDWSDELLSHVGLARDQLPAVQSASARAGALQAQAAAELGLNAGTPVMTGAADTACSALGVGAVDAGSLLLTLSSGGQLVLPVDSASVDRRGRIHTFCSALPSDDGPGWYQMGAMLSAGLALRWLRDEVFCIGGDDAYERMSEWAAESPAGANGLLFLPYLSGERTPHMDPQARGVFLGLTAVHGRCELVRAVMEGVALACYDGFCVLAELDARPQSIILAGGGARSAVWRQIVSDLFGLPVLPSVAEEQSAVGAAILAGAGVGWFGVAEAARAWASYDEIVEPNPHRTNQYADLFEIFRAAYDQNVLLFRRLDEWCRTQ